MHPLAEIIDQAARGRFVAAEGGWQRVPPWRPGVEAVVAFTGHAVLAVDADLSDARLDALGVDGFGGANHPRVLLDLAGPGGWIDNLDALLVARREVAETGDGLIDRPDLAEHPRVQFARRLRDEVRVLGHRDRERTSVATLSRGIAGLTEISIELEPDARGRGAGAAFIRAALAASAGELVVAAVAPGNAASLRAFLGAGFTPVGSIQVLRPRRDRVLDPDCTEGATFDQG